MEEKGRYKIDKSTNSTGKLIVNMMEVLDETAN